MGLRFTCVALLAVSLGAGCDADDPDSADAGAIVDARPSPPRGDIYVPPPPVPDGGPPPADIEACSAHIVRTLARTASDHGCDDYNELERNDLDGPFNRQEVVSACTQLTCEGRTLEGHNGIPAVRTCADLIELQAVIQSASRSAVDGACDQPSFKVRVIPLEEFVGGEPCDQFFCTVGPDGALISQLD